MIHLINTLLGRHNVPKIIGKFQRTTDKLEKARDYHSKRAAKKESAAERAKAKAGELYQASAHAGKLASNFRALIGADE